MCARMLCAQCQPFAHPINEAVVVVVGGERRPGGSATPLPVTLACLLAFCCRAGGGATLELRRNSCVTLVRRLKVVMINYLFHVVRFERRESVICLIKPSVDGGDQNRAKIRGQKAYKWIMLLWKFC